MNIKQNIKQIALEHGFQSIGIASINLDQEHNHYQDWINLHYHGEMSYMERNIDKRLEPQKLVPDTLSVICCRMDYLTQSSAESISLLDHPSKAYISRYALGRDYHKLIRKRLQCVADDLSTIVGKFGSRVFTDSAPILEKALAVKAGIGWRGKHSNILHREHGSWFFLGEIFTDMPLEEDEPLVNHCGDCSACIDKCPTDAIIKPYCIDARKCISYLTIEHHSAIPVEHRAAIGNRIYGCDDCQLYCPWNKYEKPTSETDFNIRNNLSDIELLDAFSWTEDRFLKDFEGSPIRRIGHEKWLRNIAVALGNAVYSPHIVNQLKQSLPSASILVAEHIEWALDQQLIKQR